MRIREVGENPEKRNLEKKEIQDNKYPNINLEELITRMFREEKKKENREKPSEEVVVVKTEDKPILTKEEILKKYFMNEKQNKETQSKEMETGKSSMLQEEKQKYIDEENARIAREFNKSDKAYWASVRELMIKKTALNKETDKEQIKSIRRELQELRKQRELYILERDLALAELEFYKRGDKALLEGIDGLRERFIELRKQIDELENRNEETKSIDGKSKTNTSRQAEKVEPKNDFRESLRVEVNNANQNVQSNNRGKIKKEFKEVDAGYLQLLTKKTCDSVKSEIVLGSENHIGSKYSMWSINGESKNLYLMQLYSRETKNGKVVKEYEKGEHGSEKSFEANYNSNSYNTIEVERSPIFEVSDNNLDIYDEKNIVGSYETIRSKLTRQQENGDKYTKETCTDVYKYDDLMIETETSWIDIENKMGNQHEMSCVEKINGKPLISVSQKNGITTLTRYTPDGEKLCSFRYDSEGKPMDKTKIIARDANGKNEIVEQPLCFPSGVGERNGYILKSIDFSDSQWLGKIMTSDFVNALEPRKHKDIYFGFESTQYVKDHKEYLDKMEKENQVVKNERSR